MQPTVERYGSGHINETYLVTCPEGPRYIYQKINTSIFKDPDVLMENISRVTEHIRRKHPDDPRCTLTVLDYARPWRQYAFIEGARTYDLIERPEQAFKAAKPTGGPDLSFAALSAARASRRSAFVAFFSER